MPEPIYLDHNATTPLHPEVKRAITEMLDIFGNPSSLHAFGREAKARLENARVQVADLVGAKPHEVVFTGSGSEANNTVLSLLRCNKTACRCDLGTRKVWSPLPLNTRASWRQPSTCAPSGIRSPS